MPLTSSPDFEWPEPDLVTHFLIGPVVLEMDRVPIPTSMWSRHLDDIYLHPGLDIYVVTVRRALGKCDEAWSA